MKLHIFDKETGPAAQQALVEARVADVLLGELQTRQIRITPAGDDAGAMALDVVRDDTAQPSADGRALLMVAFQFKDAPQPDLLNRYVSDRQPALERHGGRVVLSGLTQRRDDWHFDGIEMIDFPSLGTLHELMGDDDYRSRTAQSGSVFGGAFAVAHLQPLD